MTAGDTPRDVNQTDVEGVSMVETSTDRGPPPRDLDTENCTDVVAAPDERTQPMDGVPCNETEEEREFRLHNERVNHVNMVKAYVLIGVVVTSFETQKLSNTTFQVALITNELIDRWSSC